MSTIRLPIRLTPKQAEVDAHPARFKFLKVGRRGGKTRYEPYWLTKNALRLRAKHWYVTKTMSLAREEFWPHLMDLLPRKIIARVNDAMLEVRLTNGSVIKCKTAEKPDNLRGRGLGSYVLDEAAFCAPSIHDTILRPQLADFRGPAMVSSSPKKGWFTQRCKRIESGLEKDHALFHWTLYDNPHIDRDEIESIKATTPDHVWRQEYMAEEISQTGQVVEEFAAASIFNPAEKFAERGKWPHAVGMDWGHDDYTGVIWAAVDPASGYVVFHRMHKQRGWDASRHAAVIHQLSMGLNVKPGDFVLDQSAFRDDSRGSIADIFAKADLRCVPATRDQGGSLDLLKRFFRGDGVTPWAYVSSDCGDLIDGLQSWEWGSHEPDMVAAARYALEYAVRRHMTALTSMKIKPASKAAPVLTDEALLGGLARLPRGSASGFKWDFEAGVPG